MIRTASLWALAIVGTLAGFIVLYVNVVIGLLLCGVPVEWALWLGKAAVNSIFIAGFAYLIWGRPTTDEADLSEYERLKAKYEAQS